MFNAICIALLVATILYIIVLCYELYSKIKENKSKKLSKVAKDLFSVAMISAITEALNKNLTENNEKTEKDK